ncbi:MAG: hypothetical protein RR603_02225 [Kurthia sp.]|uniref:YtxH domain-containing protein n=1 Tax=Kurthia zopfii TaxID=1650 RepID=A0A2U3AFJ8_9BACL|nr:hypothetical protein [Kurthia zopfii]PWI23323.1 hypothetical protein DF281_03420 [Kurthia zopfii]TDR42191.1 hypothetical protein DFR61_10481 [Kurthia zopfii]STX10890.1 Uncharacterised protein [Kurthia zopfii]VEI05741.1 Uncharacterised protein [Kurthia zopfii]GEK29870.1 hypothetical protein KZO01_01790 [Kurthia zopfii]
MGKKSTSLLLAGLAAGAYAYFKKPENRDKAVEAFNSTKVKVNDFIETQKQNLQDRSNTDSSNSDTTVTGDVNEDYHLDEKDMVSEGALTSVQYYNEEAQERLDAKRNLQQGDN